MHDDNARFHGRRIDTPLDAAERWIDGTARWPLRILIAAIICPIILSFGGETAFVFYWDLFTGAGSLGWGTMLALAPLVAAGLLIASRFPSSLQARSACCALSALVPVAIVGCCIHWSAGALVLGLILVAAGNRTAGEFTIQRAPRVMAAVGGAILLLLAFLPVSGSSLMSVFLRGASWSHGGWMFNVGILGTLVFAASGVGLAIPRLPRESLSHAIGISARLTLAWAPLCLLFGRLSIAQQPFDWPSGFDLAGATMAFKMFGILYPILIAGAAGVSAWATVAMWQALDARAPREEVPLELQS